MITRKSLFSLVAILLLHTQLSLSQLERRIDPETQKKIDDFVKNVYLPQAQAQGLGLTIMQNDGELLYTTGYGSANIEKGIPNGNDTQFGTGSISKGFSALVVVKTLREYFPEMGEAVLDTPVVKLAPKLNITFIDRYRTEQITIRDLLAQRHCLGVDWLPIAAESLPTRDEAMYRQRYLKQLCGFRSSMAYSNAMITMAGEVAASIANKTFEELAQDVFDVLGMNNSAFVKASDDFSQLPGRAQPYYISENEAHPYNTELIKRIATFNPAGGLFTTPNDMARYLQLILRRGRLEGKQIIPREVIDWIVKPSNTLGMANYKQQNSDKPVSDFAYGLGWMIGSYDGWQMIEHGGSNAPYSAQAAVFPAKNLVIFTAIHEGPERTPRITLSTFIFETLSGNPNATEVAMGVMNNPEELGEQVDVMYRKRSDSEDILRKLKETKKNAAGHFAITSGTYGNGAYGDLQITERFNSERNETQYYLQFGKWYQGWLNDAIPGFPGLLYALELDTDAWHDFYGVGLPQAKIYLAETTVGEVPSVAVLVGDLNSGFILIYAEFLYGNGLDTLPVIPWEPDSCGI